MADSVQRVDVGFSGGQVLSLSLEGGPLEDLRKALGGSGFHKLKAEDGEVAIDLAQVAYVRVDSEEHRIGFSGQ